ncbi:MULTISPECIES: hypothetical protein [Actinosynnema]|uniref:Uncharacterized protein n=1 Tax=Actinosynnema pretiosum TaxID=42197 RepID=A0A290YYU5_9PSEU|nr:hypothetical protein [Actinosynnema pretiosum]ATE51927.1 hypothetical protein CNX65_00355 [Actinosynnema pretiosum]
MSEQPGPPAEQPAPGEPAPAQGRKPRRRRVVLADPKGRGRVLRTIIELEEQTSVGEKLVRDLIRQQLRTAFVLGGGTLLAVALLPLLFYLVDLSEVQLFGVRLPWLLLGLVPFPLFYLVGLLSRRQAERHERDFVSMVDR